MRIYFNTVSVLTSYNLELPYALAKQGIEKYVEIHHPLLFAMYLLEMRRLRFWVLPPYIGSFFRKYLISKVDVVHLNDFNFNIARHAKSLGKPIVFVLHAAPFTEEFYRLANDFVDVYVAPSKFTYENEVRKIGSKKIVVIPHGVNVDLFSTSIPRSYARRRLGIPENAKVVLWNDRVSPEKDLELFLDAAEIILGEVKEAFIYIKGRGVVKDYLRKLSNKLMKLKKTGRVMINIGWMPHHKLPLLYRAADIFVRTSIYENFGLGVIEAMVSGVPVVAPKRATFPEILSIFPEVLSDPTPTSLADKIMHLLNDDKLRLEIGEKARNIAKERYNWNAIALKYVQLYESLLEETVTKN